MNTKSQLTNFSNNLGQKNHDKHECSSKIKNQYFMEEANDESLIHRANEYSEEQSQEEDKEQ